MFKKWQVVSGGITASTCSHLSPRWWKQQSWYCAHLGVTGGNRWQHLGLLPQLLKSTARAVVTAGGSRWAQVVTGGINAPTCYHLMPPAFGGNRKLLIPPNSCYHLLPPAATCCHSVSTCYHRCYHAVATKLFVVIVYLARTFF